MPDLNPQRRNVLIKQRAASRAQGKAAVWVRANHPEVWATLYAEATEVERARMAERELSGQL